MLGTSSGPLVSIEVEDPLDFYTNGDIIKGKVIVKAKKSFDVRNIEIKLRCEDFAEVFVSDPNGGHSEREKVRFISIVNTLFPGENITKSGSEEDSIARYTLQEGEHEFNFAFQVPMDSCYPQTIDIKGSRAGVKWYLKCTVHRGHRLIPDRRTLYRFEMRPALSLFYDPMRSTSTSLKSDMNIYLPGYAAQAKTPSGMLRGLIPGQSQYKKHTGVSLTVIKPEEGLLQDPAPLNISFDITSPDDSLLIIRHFTLSLKRKTIVTVKRYTNTFKEVYPILEFKDLNLPIKEGLHFLQQKTNHTTVKGRIPATFTNQHFDVKYKLVALASVSSKEKTNSIEKIRISSPTTLHPYQPVNGAQVKQDMYEPLPEYNLKAGANEQTVKRD